MMKKILALMLSILLALSVAVPATAQTMAQVVTFGYYGYEPIDWIVLSSDAQYTKLMSEYAIACKPFGYSTDWNASYLRAWLNSDFLYEAFSYDERMALCMQGNDLVRLPSIQDMTNPYYGFSPDREEHDPSRSARGSMTAVSQGLWTNDDGYCSYYTLTPDSRTTLLQVRTSGKIGVARYDRTNVGVRPIIVVLTAELP